MKQSRDNDRKPRPYSRLETDDELLVRVRAAAAPATISQCGGEYVDTTAERYKIARRIIWIIPH